MLFPLLFDVFQVISLTIRISERRTDLVFAGIFLSNLSFCGDLPACSNQVLFQYICNRYYYYYPILSRHALLFALHFYPMWRRASAPTLCRCSPLLLPPLLRAPLR